MILVEKLFITLLAVFGFLNYLRLQSGGMLLFSRFIIFLGIPSQFLLVLADNSYYSKNGQDLLLCRKCGADVVDSYYLFTQLSAGSRKTKKQNLFGKQNVTVQTLVNPFGVQFDIVTTEKARCDHIGSRQRADSWFPGYTWRLCACPHCGQHLGWTFEIITDNTETHSKGTPKEPLIQMFHGIILDNILGENFTDSLIMMPKMYSM